MSGVMKRNDGTSEGGTGLRLRGFTRVPSLVRRVSKTQSLCSVEKNPQTELPMAQKLGDNNLQ